MLIRWIARPDACAECRRLAAGSPYERLPTWPGLGDTKCECRCSVEGTRAGNVMAMAGSVAPVEAPSVAVDDSATAALDDAPVSAPLAATSIEPARVPLSTLSLPSLPSFRVRPLERRWALALGALIFLAAFVAIFSSGH